MATGAYWDVTNPKKPKGIKDPDAVIDIIFDWAVWLADISDAYLSHTLTPVGITVDSSNEAAGAIQVFVSDGVVGTPASVTCRITTVGGRTDDRTLYLKIEER